MKRFLTLALFWTASFGAFAQDAAAIAAQREAEEIQRRTSATLENLQLANQAQQRRIEELFREVAALRRQIIEVESKFKNSQIGAVTSSDIRKAYDKMAEIEKNRQADNNLVKDQFDTLKKLLDKAPVVIAPAPVIHNDPPKNRPDPTPEPEAPPFTGEYYPYIVQKGDNLTKIIAAFNAQLKEKGKPPVTLDQVKKANPKMNPNNMIVGREIKIPVTDK